MSYQITHYPSKAKWYPPPPEPNRTIVVTLVAKTFYWLAVWFLTGQNGMVSLYKYFQLYFLQTQANLYWTNLVMLFEVATISFHGIIWFNKPRLDFFRLCGQASAQSELLAEQTFLFQYSQNSTHSTLYRVPVALDHHKTRWTTLKPHLIDTQNLHISCFVPGLDSRTKKSRFGTKSSAHFT